eukprot:6173026-Pleurochrysis_carterae.AAC.1
MPEESTRTSSSMHGPLSSIVRMARTDALRVGEGGAKLVDAHHAANETGSNSAAERMQHLRMTVARPW